MALSQAFAVAVALTRIRRIVLLCCWLVGLALGAQTVVWALATYTDLRFDQPAVQGAKAPAVVRREAARSGAPTVGQLAPPAPATSAQDPAASAGDRAALMDASGRLHSRLDHTFETIVTAASGAGSIGFVALLALLAVGVILASATATPGVEKTVSAFIWALLVAAMALPVGRMLHAEGFEGSFTSYRGLARAVDAARGEGPSATAGTSPTSGAATAAATMSGTAQPAGSPGMPGAAPMALPPATGAGPLAPPAFPSSSGATSVLTATQAASNQQLTQAEEEAARPAAGLDVIDASPGGAMFYVRYLLLPLTCIVGLVMIGLRFSAGVEAAVIRTEYRLDPALEREAANIKASSLHSTGRTAAALGIMGGGSPPPMSSAPAGPLPPIPSAAGPGDQQSATRVSPGVAPRRII